MANIHLLNLGESHAFVSAKHSSPCSSSWNLPVVIQCSYLILLPNEAYTVGSMGNREDDSYDQIWIYRNKSKIVIFFTAYWRRPRCTTLTSRRSRQVWTSPRLGAECGCGNNIARFCWSVGSWRSRYVCLLFTKNNSAYTSAKLPADIVSPSWLCTWWFAHA